MTARLEISAGTVAAAIAIAVFGLSCSSIDFFEYAKNTGFDVVERPKSYGSSRFGSQIAATGDLEYDILAVSAGRGSKTAFYDLAVDGKIKTLEAPRKSYPSRSTTVQETGSGASLAGLPSWWAEKPETKEPRVIGGCIAIGQPGAGEDEDEPRIALECLGADFHEEKIYPPNPRSAEVKSSLSHEGFGQKLAAIRPEKGGERFLLAAAANRYLVVYSASGDASRSQIADLRSIADPFYSDSESVFELAAGRGVLPSPGDDTPRPRYFVAATVNDHDEFRTLLFVQNGKSLERAACLKSTGSPGLGGVMTTGDLDADGDDELIIAPSALLDRRNEVRIYRVARLIEEGDPGGCLGDDFAPDGTLTPGATDESISCGNGCDFGKTLVAGDIAADDAEQELIIGAPGATVDGKSGAGAVYVYRGPQALGANGAAPVAGYVVDSWPESGHQLGGGLAVAPIAGRNELVVGLTGKGQFAVAFCTGVGENIEVGGDVPTDSSGKVVSTRCRPK